ncbi:tetraspanin-8 isoform X9 [Eubalaena glacialis]|uniref:tetraspanin-8 isoform X9 n=1 Tax=Eubalaena glacialis TaxID=27606 RepID=UPI002A59DBE9|nr:tetraspanin-8 isoform X9 [Eubalaena glacialis]
MAGVSVCVKYSMFIFNFVSWLCGASILAVAIWLRVGKDGREILSPGDATINPYIAVNILIVVGAIIMILGFLGCFGAMKENQFMLVLFFVGLILILLLQVVAGILGATNKSKTERALNETLQTNVHLLSATNENGKLFQKAFSEIQEEVIRICTWSDIFYCPVLPDQEEISLWMCQVIIGQTPLKFCFGFVTLNI